MTTSPYADHLKHLRAVHFSLVVTCTAVVLAAMFASRPDVIRAIDDLQEIRTAMTKMRDHPHVLDDYVGRKVDIPVLERSRWFATVDGTVHQFNLGKRNWILTEWTSTDETSNITKGLPWTDHDWSLSAFEGIWEKLKSVKVTFIHRVSEKVYWPGEMAHIAQAGGDVRMKAIDATLSDAPPGDVEETVALAIRAAADDDLFPLQGDLSDLDFVQVGFGYEPSRRYPFGKLAGHDLWIPSGMLGSKEVNGRVAIIEEFGVALPVTSFADAFPELTEMTRDYRDLSLGNLTRVLDSERKRTGSQFEILGTKVPLTGVQMYGPLVILLIQLYLALHLDAFAKRAWPEGATRELIPWLGTYGDIPSRTALHVSAVILPVSAIGALTFWAATDSGRWWGYVLAASALLISAAVGAWTYWRLKDLPQSASSSSGEAEP